MEEFFYMQSHISLCTEIKVGDLQEFLLWFILSRSVPNIATVAMDGLSSGRGIFRAHHSAPNFPVLPTPLYYIYIYWKLNS